MNAFEIIMANQKAINDNIHQLSENVARVYEAIQNITESNTKPLQPTVRGDEGKPEDSGRK